MSVFHDDNKNYPEIFLNEFFYKLAQQGKDI